MATFHNAIILIKSVVNKNKNKYYYNMFLEKVSYKDCLFIINDRIDVSEGINVNKASAPKECDISHY